MAEPEMVSAGNRPVTPGEMVSETLPTPQHLVLINNALPAINRGGVISVGNHVHLLTAVEFNNQRQSAAAGNKRRKALYQSPPFISQSLISPSASASSAICSWFPRTA